MLPPPAHHQREAFGTSSSECPGYQYAYDTNGDLIKESVLYDSETIPGTMYYYKAVEVDASRATCLLEQQKYLISVP